MQDFTKDEFGLLGGSVVGSDKVLDPAGSLIHVTEGLISSNQPFIGAHQIGSHQYLNHQHHQQFQHGAQILQNSSGLIVNGSTGTVTDEIKLSQSNSDLIDTTGGSKLEETDRHLYPWNTSHIGSQFLRSSDDPLISGGTNDNQNDNELSVATASQSMCSSPTPSPTQKHRNTIPVPTSILSPELPDTPISPVPTPKKASNAQSTRRNTSTGGSRQRRKGPLKLRFHHQALPPEYLDHYEATQNLTARREQLLLQQQQGNTSGIRASRMDRHAIQEREDSTNESVRNWLQKILELQKEGVSLAPIKDDAGSTGESNTQRTTSVQPNKIVNYTDLPYMGEMTLENSKPRRGRKPKKADICHLIYKNYGTILPGTPNAESVQERSMNGHRTQTRSSSLLERRLMTAEKNATSENGKGKREEPLNLCVRDVEGESVALSSSEDESDEVYGSSCPTPIITPSDLSTDQALATNMKMSLPNLQNTGLPTPSSTETPSTADTPPVYWPNVNGFIHPMALYYQKLVDSNNTVPAAGQASSSISNSNPSTPTDTQLPKTSTASSAASTTPPSSPATPKREHQQTLVPKPISQLIKPEKTHKITQETQTSTSKNSPPAQKRKRSAIFIPPVPAENSTNPATEVSICKFKFTGGVKPCLQEKKMLSVDSGGNFRYYSGTGDKSMRGYEFFPRESLQQSSLHSSTTAGAFLNTPPVEKITCDIPPPSLGLGNDILQIPDFPSAGPNLPGLPSPGSASTSSNQRLSQRSESSEARRARRRSRRSSQRECLEKTFKEKGFLIQTQQLQSAEGATYCKFRQLRKFTRYLFRSWKDYLPGELHQDPTGLAPGEHPQLSGLSINSPEGLLLDDDSPLLDSPNPSNSSPSPFNGIGYLDQQRQLSPSPPLLVASEFARSTQVHPIMTGFRRTPSPAPPVPTMLLHSVDQLTSPEGIRRS
ncbi:uncharacterized protein LOC129748230 isoform X2 [Uranotaenia lowii]|nr:uncharacterized protein LOC129748230 isoform X2 [Uranotaenia lowii]